MRIAIVTWSGRQAGGVETYLAGVIPALVESGHEVALWIEMDTPSERDPIVARDDVPVAVAKDLGPDTWLKRLRDWRPDVVYAHGLTDPSLETRINAAPVVFFAHGYFGTCISGTKTWQSPDIRTCTRKFGVACLGHFYPHRCGGLNPFRMWSEYRVQSRRRATLHNHAIVAVASEHMRREYLRHDFPIARIRHVPLPVPTQPHPPPHEVPSGDAPWRLVFAGRMDRLKGGERMIASLPTIRQQLGRPVELTVLGDGPERLSWERAAGELERAPQLSVKFKGWVGRAERDEIFSRSDLFVMPSLWPEPFGLAGLEAGAHGLPTAAYRVGGIPEWLIDGVNGHTSTDMSRTGDGLATAIASCLDGESYPALRQGAVAAASSHSMPRHVDALNAILEEVAR